MSRLKTVPIAQRRNKVESSLLAHPPRSGPGGDLRFADFWNSLPDILAAWHAATARGLEIPAVAGDLPFRQLAGTGGDRERGQRTAVHPTPVRLPALLEQKRKHLRLPVRDGPEHRYFHHLSSRRCTELGLSGFHV